MSEDLSTLIPDCLQRKICLICGGVNSRKRNSFTCSQKCYRRYFLRVNPKSCVVCGKEHGRRGKTCSNKCATELKKKTNLEKFGSEWAIQTNAAKERRIKTNIKKYGVAHALQTVESMNRLQKTNLSKYGVRFPGQSDVIKGKIAATNLERYGNSCAAVCESVRNKIAATNKEKYGSSSPFGCQSVRDKAASTVLSKYGVVNVFQSSSVKGKIAATNLERYGSIYPSQNKDIKKKIIETNLSRYGVKRASELEVTKQKMLATNLERYGCVTPLWTPENKFKANRVSQLNKRFAEAVRSEFGLAVELEVAVENCAFDLFIPEFDLFIDLNPTISHNVDRGFMCEIKKHDFDCGHFGVSETRHQDRALFAVSKGLDLLQLYAWNMDLVTVGKKLQIKQDVATRGLVLSSCGLSLDFHCDLITEKLSSLNVTVDDCFISRPLRHVVKRDGLVFGKTSKIDVGLLDSGYRSVYDSGFIFV